MRTSEWIQAGFTLIVAGGAWFFPLPRGRRKAISILALVAIAFIALGWASQYVLPPVPSSMLRDWLPIFITLIPYWQTGQFFVRPNQKFQAWLCATDRWVPAPPQQTGWGIRRILRLTMEWAYALCYGVLPLALGTLYIAGRRRDVDIFWFFVLVPTYLCYAITPFFPALPPRLVDGGNQPARTTKSRAFNLWLLKYASIQAISFPSAHAASSLGVALMLLRYLPTAGSCFLILAIWIGVAAVIGRYHYTIDVVLGAVVALAVYFVWRAGWIPSTLLTTPASILVARF